MAVKEIDLKAVLESKLAPPDENGCRGKLNRTHDGYWVFKRKGKEYLAHKLALCIKTNQPYDNGRKIHAAHDCPGGDNKWCCTPEHLSWMTPKQHKADMIAKGQLPTGEKHWSFINPGKIVRGDENGNAKLTEPEVKEIKKLYATGKWTIR